MTTTRPSLEARLQALEQKMGLVPDAAYATSSNNNKTDGNQSKATATLSPKATIEERLQALEERSQEVITCAPQLRDLWKESDQLMSDLDPGTALTHQQQILAPILYRRQEVLATADSLQEHLRLLAQIAQYLQVQPASSSSQQQQPCTDWTPLDTVLQAPIVRLAPNSSSLMSPAEQQERLQALEETLRDVHVRTQQVSQKLDHSLNLYEGLVLAVSEKMVLALEALL